MEKKYYEQLNETLYSETFANGLSVTLLPKNEFHKTYGLFTTKYGSIDNQFTPLGQEERVKVPDGIAHFLEHKLFEKEDGDVFQVFGKQGASANAFTSFTRTSYLFSSTSNVLQNMTTLLDFVQDPYFTDETVEKEKGIIAQEIQMYEDEPDWRLFFGILGNLYPKHPLHIDIAGTVESIGEISAEVLYQCYQTFYHPSNMNVFVVGKMDPEEMMGWIRDNQKKKTFAEAKEIRRYFPEEKIADIIPFDSIKMEVNRAKSIIGIKGTGTVPAEEAALVYKTKMDILLNLLFGPTSDNYLRLYNEGVIDDSFSYDFNLERTFYFAEVGGDAKDPKAFSEAVKSILLTSSTSSELTEEHLSLVKKRMIGQILQSLNSLEFIAHQYSQQSYGEATLFDLVPVIENIVLSDLKRLAEEFMQEEHMSIFTILPAEKNNLK